MARILAIDDDPAQLVLLALFLGGAGHEVNGRKTATDTELPNLVADVDLVILDLVMPERSGTEILRAIRSHAAIAQVPVLLVSASLDGPLKLLEAGLSADGFLPKPFSPEVVCAEVASLLAQKRGATGGRR